MLEQRQFERQFFPGVKELFSNYGSGNFVSTKKGNRPSYTRSSRPDIAIPLYEQFLVRLTLDLGRSVQCGEFGADMQVSLCNDGPVTIIIDSKQRE